MGYRYCEFKNVTEDMPEELANAYRLFNNTLMAEGVRGLACLDVRPTTLGEKIDMLSFIPAGCHVSSVEVYENGAANYRVRNQLEKVIGVLTFRPLTDI